MRTLGVCERASERASKGTNGERRVVCSLVCLVLVANDERIQRASAE